jgi:hypothetical protein
VKSDWAAVHDWLLDGFPQITDVLATTMTGTLLIVHEGDAEADAWLDGISEAILIRRLSAPRRGPHAGVPSPMSRARTNVHGRGQIEPAGPRSHPATGRRRPGKDAA